MKGEKTKTREDQSRGGGYSLVEKQARLELSSNSRDEDKKERGKDNTYIRLGDQA